MSDGFKVKISDEEIEALNKKLYRDGIVRCEKVYTLFKYDGDESRRDTYSSAEEKTVEDLIAKARVIYGEFLRTTDADPQCFGYIPPQPDEPVIVKDDGEVVRTYEFSDRISWGWGFWVFPHR